MGKNSQEWKSKEEIGRKVYIGRGQVLQKVIQIVIVLMMKKISVNLQSTLSAMCIEVIFSSPNKNNIAIARRRCAALAPALPQ